MCLLCALIIGFIFMNSSFNADLSSSQSLGVRQFLNSVLKSLSINITLTEHFVRKCAHFVEYFVLGTTLYFTVLSFVRRLNKLMFIAPAVGLFVAIIDEFIQRFSSGRSAQVSDVILDFSGVCTAIIFVTLITLLINKIKKDKEVKIG